SGDNEMALHAVPLRRGPKAELVDLEVDLGNRAGAARRANELADQDMDPRMPDLETRAAVTTSRVYRQIPASKNRWWGRFLCERGGAHDRSGGEQAGNQHNGYPSSDGGRSIVG